MLHRMKDKGTIKDKLYLRPLMLIGLVILLIGSIVACAAPSTPVSAIKVTAQELYSAYTSNTTTADAQYKNKILDVSGTVSVIGNDIFGKAYIDLAVSGNGVVQCHFISLSEDALLHMITIGQTVTIRGPCEGYTTPNVVLGGCTMAPS
jgi:hypothetical protein